MRIGIVSDVFYPYLMGGAERRYWEVARRLARDHEVHVFTMRWHGAPREEVVEGVRIHRLNVPRGLYSGGRRSIWAALRFTAALLPPSLKDWDLDIIDANQFPFLPLFPSRLMASRNRCPLVATWHEVWGEYWHEYMGSRLYGAIGKGIERLSSRLPDRIIAVSEKTKEGLVGRLDIPPERISVIPNGVDLELINSIKVEREDYKIVYAGRLLPHKNVDALIRAMPRVLREVPGAKLTIVGEGPMKMELIRLTEGLNLEDSVEWRGDLDYPSVLREIKSATVLV
ncbi:MAG: glycosyltransferase family 4 protein, partial [Candidatus Hydrothermarchaeota archaeon]